MNIEYYQPDFSLTITIAERILNQINDIATKYYPCEIGGVLVGEYFNNTRAVITEIIQPSVYKSSRFYFERDTVDINGVIRNLYAKTDGKILYLGEWHSHPDASTQYSQRDFQSMLSIASSKMVVVKNPILLIISIRGATFEPKFYVFKKGNLYEYEKS